MKYAARPVPMCCVNRNTVPHKVWYKSVPDVEQSHVPDEGSNCQSENLNTTRGSNDWICACLKTKITVIMCTSSHTYTQTQADRQVNYCVAGVIHLSNH